MEGEAQYSNQFCPCFKNMSNNNTNPVNFNCQPAVGDNAVEFNNRTFNLYEWQPNALTRPTAPFDIIENIQLAGDEISTINYTFSQDIERIISSLIEAVRNHIETRKLETEALNNRVKNQELIISESQQTMHSVEKKLNSEMYILKLEKEFFRQETVRYEAMLDHIAEKWYRNRLLKFAFNVWFKSIAKYLPRKQPHRINELGVIHNDLRIEKYEKEIMKLHLEKAQLANTVKTAVMRGLCLLNTETLSVLGPIDNLDKNLCVAVENNGDKNKVDIASLREFYSKNSNANNSKLNQH